MFSEHVRDPGRALGYYERSRDLRERLARENPAVVEYRENLARSLVNLAIIHRTHDRPSDALAIQQAGPATLRAEIARRGPRATSRPGGTWPATSTTWGGRSTR